MIFIFGYLIIGLFFSLLAIGAMVAARKKIEGSDSPLRESKFQLQTIIKVIFLWPMLLFSILTLNRKWGVKRFFYWRNRIK